ncbi:hypothetical protein GUJ93_ZPchr0002g24205 [Zizania palustris]|uniref:Uncharacterized protein n=1 Tax=Zizania palustris TaxID=103762 RepID=A0A8J5V3G4_ZIZPA|nr:hypothetical protein GUJ93_ZPchr0002g24205 [Zizania palustris]
MARPQRWGRGAATEKGEWCGCRGWGVVRHGARPGMAREEGAWPRRRWSSAVWRGRRGHGMTVEEVPTEGHASGGDGEGEGGEGGDGNTTIKNLLMKVIIFISEERATMETLL